MSNLYKRLWQQFKLI